MFKYVFTGMMGAIVHSGGDNWGTGLAIDNVTVAKILTDNITNNQIFAADIQNGQYTILLKVPKFNHYQFL